MAVIMAGIRAGIRACIRVEVPPQSRSVQARASKRKRKGRSLDAESGKSLPVTVGWFWRGWSWCGIASMMRGSGGRLARGCGVWDTIYRI